jgi:hypothetical protein
MAKCDEGYLCSVCGEDVAEITDSDLYLRFVIGQIDPEVLHTTPERHIRCNPALAQFIIAPEFEPIVMPGDFDKSLLDSDFRADHEQLVTRGWRRLQELKGLSIAIHEYPLPEIIDRWQR